MWQAASPPFQSELMQAPLFASHSIAQRGIVWKTGTVVEGQAHVEYAVLSLSSLRNDATDSTISRYSETFTPNFPAHSIPDVWHPQVPVASVMNFCTGTCTILDVSCSSENVEGKMTGMRKERMGFLQG